MSSGAALTAAHLERAAYVYIRQSSDVQARPTSSVSVYSTHCRTMRRSSASMISR